MIDVHGDIFEIFTLVSKIHENMDLVLGIKNIFELEGKINSQESYFSSLNRSIPFTLKKSHIESKRTKIYKDRGTLHR